MKNLYKNLTLTFSLAASCALLTTPAFAQGFGVRNGGENEEIRFHVTAARIFKFLTSQSGQMLFPELAEKQTQITEVFSRTQIQMTEDAVTDSYQRVRTCINIPDQLKILCNRERWVQERKDTFTEHLMVLHEYFGLLGLETTQHDLPSTYTLSLRILPHMQTILNGSSGENHPGANPKEGTEKNFTPKKSGKNSRTDNSGATPNNESALASTTQPLQWIRAGSSGWIDWANGSDLTRTPFQFLCAMTLDSAGGASKAALLANQTTAIAGAALETKSQGKNFVRLESYDLFTYRNLFWDGREFVYIESVASNQEYPHQYQTLYKGQDIQLQTTATQLYLFTRDEAAAIHSIAFSRSATSGEVPGAMTVKHLYTIQGSAVLSHQDLDRQSKARGPMYYCVWRK